MLKKFLGEPKDLVIKYRLNKKYTSEERLSEVQKIVREEIATKEFEQKESLLQLALDIGHPLKLRSNELQEELEQTLELVIIQLIKCKEVGNKEVKKLYIGLESLNDKLYTVIAHKLRSYELDIQRANILKFFRPIKQLQAKIQKQLSIPIEKTYLCEKEDAIYVEELRKKYKRQTTYQKMALLFYIISYFGILYRQKDWFKKINKYYRFAIFGLAGAIMLYFR